MISYDPANRGGNETLLRDEALLLLPRAVVHDCTGGRRIGYAYYYTFWCSGGQEHWSRSTL
jgi:hypothetical protein